MFINCCLLIRSCCSGIYRTSNTLRKWLSYRVVWIRECFGLSARVNRTAPQMIVHQEQAFLPSIPLTTPPIPSFVSRASVTAPVITTTPATVTTTTIAAAATTVNNIAPAEAVIEGLKKEIDSASSLEDFLRVGDKIVKVVKEDPKQKVAWESAFQEAFLKSIEKLKAYWNLHTESLSYAPPPILIAGLVNLCNQLNLPIVENYVHETLKAETHINLSQLVSMILPGSAAEALKKLLISRCNPSCSSLEISFLCTMLHPTPTRDEWQIFIRDRVAPLRTLSALNLLMIVDSPEKVKPFYATFATEILIEAIGKATDADEIRQAADFLVAICPDGFPKPIDVGEKKEVLAKTLSSFLEKFPKSFPASFEKYERLFQIRLDETVKEQYLKREQEAREKYKEETLPTIRSLIEDCLRNKGGDEKHIKSLSSYIRQLPSIYPSIQEFFSYGLFMSIKAIRMLLIHIGRKAPSVNYRLFESIEEFQKALRTIDINLDQQLGWIVYQSEHFTPVNIRVENRKITAVVTDSVSKYEQRRYQDTYIRDALASLFPLNITIIMADISRQKDSTSCSAFALRDVREFAKNPKLFDHPIWKVPVDNRDQLKVHTVKTLPPVLLKGSQQDFSQDTRNIEDRIKELRVEDVAAAKDLEMELKSCMETRARFAVSHHTKIHHIYITRHLAQYQALVLQEALSSSF